LSVSIIPHNISQTRPRRGKTEPVYFDPYRRLAAAVALQAVCDALYPRKSITPEEHRSAYQFIQSDDGQYILAEFIGPERVRLIREVLS